MISLFFIIFTSVYGAMHYALWRVLRPLLPTHPAIIPLALLWSLLMISAPLLSRFFERHDADLTARVAAWGGYLWLGLLFITLSLFTLRAVAGVTLQLARRITPTLPLLPLNGAGGTLAVLFLSFLVTGYALYEAANVRVETVRIVTPELPDELSPLRVVQISDLHLGLIHREGTLRSVTEQIQQLHPDLLVATGDMVDARLDHLEKLVPLLRALQPRLGKYAVTGNHEVYAGLKRSLDFLRQGEFTVLRNQREELPSGMIVVGVDDPATGKQIADTEVLPEQRQGFTLLLKHRPLIDPAGLGRFDLQLSGHAHRGQIAPFNLLTHLRFPMQNGLYSLGSESRLYTSRGTGTWGPPMRLFSPPEITLFIIERP